MDDVANSLAQELAIELELLRRDARSDFFSYCCAVDPTWTPSWHHQATCDAVQHALDRKSPRQLLQSYGYSERQIVEMVAEPHPITKLFAGMTRVEMIDEPIEGLQIHFGPRHGKSQIISRFLPAYYLAKNKDKHVIAASHTAPLAQELGEDVQRIIDSDEHIAIFPESKIASAGSGPGVRTKQRFTVGNGRGSYRSVGVGGNVVGRSGDLILMDDLVKSRAKAESVADQKTVQSFYRSDLYSRREKGAVMFLLNTRYHQADVAGYTIQAAQADPKAQQWMCLVFPSVLDCPPGPADPRKQGEPLWPDRWPVAKLEQIQATSGSYEFESLHQQRPSIKGGSIIRDSWWRFYDVLPQGLMGWTMSADLTFKDRGDYCAMQVWASRGAERYLVHQVHGRMTFTEQLAAFSRLARQYPQARTKLVEDAANGAALIDTLRLHIGGIIPVKAVTSKELRVQAVSPQIEAGNVLLPSPRVAPWIDGFLGEFSQFPSGAHDDQVDAACQYLLRAEKAAKTWGVPAQIVRGDGLIEPFYRPPRQGPA